MAPEMMTAGRIDERTDVYSVGALLYQAITCACPFGDASGISLAQAVVYDEPLPITSHNVAICPEVQAVISRAMSRDPDQRYATAVCMERALAEIIEARA